jgi:hypothetical protein
MKRLVPIFLIAIAACGHAPQATRTPPQKGDTSKKKEEQEDLSLTEAVREFRDSAQRETTLDTTRTVQGDTLRLVIDMSRSNAFSLPKEYLEAVELDTFTVWNMRSNIRFFINGRQKMARTIVKTDFNIDKTVRRYGVLMLPEITRLDQNGFSIDYDIDVPFSDDGMEVEVTTKGNKIKFTAQ